MKVIRHFQTFLLIALGLSVGSALATPKDAICSNLAAFASASVAEESHPIVLRGGWGGDAEDTIMTHECRHSGYEPGKKLCAYLLPNSSWEFGAHNAERAAACLDSMDSKRFLDELSSGTSPTEITSSLKLLKDKQVLVTLRFEPPLATAKPPSGISTLTISAVRAVK
jgi:hypothetical protein